MSTKDLERVIELWPGLSEEVRTDIVEIVEGNARADMRPLSPYELEMLEKSREDFKHGRFMTSDQYREDMAEFYRKLAAKAGT